jgi:small subunit ribosomal protein S11e
VKGHFLSIYFPSIASFGVFLNDKKLVSKKTAAGVRYWKNIGLGFKTPKEAIDGKYIDKKCPFTSNVSIRGKIIKGIVISANKMQRTAVLRRDYLHYIKKYNRYEKRHNNVSVHVSPCFALKEGDIIIAG